MATDAARSGAGGSGGGASAASSTSADSYIGSMISLTSKSEIRYEGVLYNINTEESSIGLRHVRSFGTEGRKKDGPQIPPSEKVYEYILFRGSDIKDLQVKSSPPVQSTSLHNDPAIIQSQYVRPASASSNLPSAGSGNVAEPSPHTAQLGLTRPTFQDNLPLHQPGGGMGSWSPSPNPPAANGSVLVMPPPSMYWQGYYPPSGGLPHLQQPAPMRPPLGMPIPPSLQHPFQYPGLNPSLPSGSQILSEFSPFATGSSTPGLTSASLPITSGLTSSSLPIISGLTSSSLPVTPTMASNLVSAIPDLNSSLLPATAGLSSGSLSATLPLSSVSTLAHDAPPSLLLNMSTLTTHPASTVGTSPSLVTPMIPDLEPMTTLPPSDPSIFSSKTNTVTIANMPYQSARQSVQPIVGSSSSSQVETSVPLMTPGQLSQTASSTIPSNHSLQTTHKEIDNRTAEVKTKPLLPDPIAPAVAEAKEPILRLPKPIAQKSGAPSRNHYSNRGRGRGRGNGSSHPVTKFTEDFDFMAMNEKFNKDEVWGHLGKGKAHLKDGELQEYEIDDVFEEEEEEVHKLEAKPVYIKDDFFDSLSCATLDRGNRNGRNKFSEQMKIDTETFGDFARHRSRGGGRGFRGAGRARGSYYGRGYGYVGRGRGYGRAA